jgi:heme b synthase
MVAWEVTRSCPLACRHCRAAAKHGPYENELTTADCEKVIDAIVAFAKPVVILTGGEPMLREDIYHIARYGSDHGLRMVMATCGILLKEENCKKLIEAGIQRLSLSLDGASAESHDGMRGVPGSFDAVMAAMRTCKKTGLAFQVNTTVTKRNMDELQQIFDCARTQGAVSFHPFLLVPTGRGKDMASEVISGDDYERVLLWFYEHRLEPGMSLKPTCAPHYLRILHENEKAAGSAAPPSGRGPDSMTKGCLGGQGFVFISHTGDLQICGFLDKQAGNIRDAGFDLKGLWESSPLFLDVRNVSGYRGKCGRCEYRFVCGGCRARAYALTGDYLAEEPSCVYQPDQDSPD